MTGDINYYETVYYLSFGNEHDELNENLSYFKVLSEFILI